MGDLISYSLLNKSRSHEVLFGAHWTLCCHCNGRRLPSLPHSCREVCCRTFLETAETGIPVCPRRCVRGWRGLLVAERSLVWSWSALPRLAQGTPSASTNA